MKFTEGGSEPPLPDPLVSPPLPHDPPPVSPPPYQYHPPLLPSASLPNVECLLTMEIKCVIFPFHSSCFANTLIRHDQLKFCICHVFMEFGQQESLVRYFSFYT